MVNQHLFPGYKFLYKAFLIITFILLDITSIKASTLLKKNDSGNFDAYIHNMTLTEIAKSMKDGLGIDFKGDDSLFHKQINVVFENLPLEKALRRVLSGCSFAFTYNKEGQVVAVTLLQNNNKMNSEPNRSAPDYDEKKKGFVPGAAQSSQLPNSIDNSVGPQQMTKNDLLALKNKEQENVHNFKAKLNSLSPLSAVPPGGIDNTNNADAIKNFQVIRNAKPPGK